MCDCGNLTSSLKISGAKIRENHVQTASRHPQVRWEDAASAGVGQEVGGATQELFCPRGKGRGRARWWLGGSGVKAVQSGRVSRTHICSLLSDVTTCPSREYDDRSQAADLTNREKLLTSCDQLGSERTSNGDEDQQGAKEHSDDSRASELQSVGSLKVTIQQSSESREFGQTDRTTDRQSGLHCHVCSISCCSLQIFQDHMMGSEHLRKMKEITHSIILKTHTEQNRRRRSDRPRWCDTCQCYYSGDVIIHRRTRDHKMCKKMSHPFCPVCQRHFRTPRKFVEHMKSPQHKQQVKQDEAQEEDLITVDAVGCFEEDQKEEEG